MSRRNKNKIETVQAYTMWERILMELALNYFKYEHLPESIDIRYMELSLLKTGKAIFFKDAEMDEYMCLRCGAEWNYNEVEVPANRNAIGFCRYYNDLNIDNSVMIYNNYLRMPIFPTISEYARRLTELERTIDVNLHQQRCPLIITTPENQALSYSQFTNQLEDFPYHIIVDKGFDMNNLKVLKTDAPQNFLDLYNIYRNLLQDALAYIGIAQTGEKRERMITSEVSTDLSYPSAMGYVRFNARKEAFDKINKMFGLNIKIKINPEITTLASSVYPGETPAFPPEDDPQGGQNGPQNEEGDNE